MPGTVHLHRVVPVAPDILFRAFTEPDALAWWLPPYGFTCRVEHMDARAGGSHRMAFTHFASGASHSFGGDYLEFERPTRLRYTDRFDDPGLPGEMVVTVDLRAVSVGTELRIEQAGIPDAIPVEACYLGWQDSLDKLVHLVTAQGGA
jgi:uncharacterized protein YndB with AHSA1/START domain